MSLFGTIVILIMHGMSGYLGLQAWSTIKYQRLQSRVNLVLPGLTAKSDTCRKNIQLGVEPKDQTKVETGHHLKNTGTNNIIAKHKAFMAGIGQAVNHNHKRFWSYCKSKIKQKNIPQTVKLNSVTSSDNS